MLQAGCTQYLRVRGSPAARGVLARYSSARPAPAVGGRGPRAARGGGGPALTRRRTRRRGRVARASGRQLSTLADSGFGNCPH